MTEYCEHHLKVDADGNLLDFDCPRCHGAARRVLDHIPAGVKVDVERAKPAEHGTYLDYRDKR